MAERMASFFLDADIAMVGLNTLRSQIKEGTLAKQVSLSCDPLAILVYDAIYTMPYLPLNSLLKSHTYFEDSSPLCLPGSQNSVSP